DVRLLASQDLTVVPGSIARNQATLGSGPNAHLEIDKFGRGFALSAASLSGAHRALAELGAIEVVGRAARLPYWSCLGASDDQPAVAAEVQDWFEAMAARPQEIIEYFQRQLKSRGIYTGAVDGQVNPALKEAVARYREALGLSREPKLTKELLAAHLRTPRRE